MSLYSRQTIQDENAPASQGLHGLFVPSVQAVLRWRPQLLQARGIEPSPILFAGSVMRESDPEAWLLQCLDEQHDQLGFPTGGLPVKCGPGVGERPSLEVSHRLLSLGNVMNQQRNVEGGDKAFSIGNRRLNILRVYHLL